MSFGNKFSWRTDSASDATDAFFAGLAVINYKDAPVKASSLIRESIIGQDKVRTRDAFIHLFADTMDVDQRAVAMNAVEHMRNINDYEYRNSFNALFIAMNMIDIQVSVTREDVSVLDVMPEDREELLRSYFLDEEGLDKDCSLFDLFRRCYSAARGDIMDISELFYGSFSRTSFLDCLDSARN